VPESIARPNGTKEKAMSVAINYTSKITATEQLETNMPAANDKQVQHNGYDTAATANATSVPPVAKCAFFQKALVGGAATIDLTALVGSNGAAVDGTGLRVQFIKFRNKSSNAAGHVMGLSKGTPNGYDGLGGGEGSAGDFTVSLLPGGEVLICTKDCGADIGPTNKTLDLMGVGTDVAELAIALG
jgi:hypothetical protein